MFPKVSTSKVILTWTCPECGEFVKQPLNEIPETGTAICLDCGFHMALDASCAIME